MFPTAHSPVTSGDGATRMVATRTAAERLAYGLPAIREHLTAFTCAEADALAVLLATTGQRDAALDVIGTHMHDESGEEGGDRHYRPDLAGAGDAARTGALNAYLDALTIGDLLGWDEQPTGGEADAVHRWVVVNADTYAEVDAYATVDAAARAAETVGYVVPRAEVDAYHAAHGGEA